MSLSMYSLTVPVFTAKLTQLAAILKKGAAFAEARKIEPEVLIQARLYPDMFPLARQIQIATDQAKGCGARLAGLEPPKFEDVEKTFPELDGRIERTLAFLKTLKPAAIEGSEDRTIRLEMRGHTREFKGLAYLLDYVYPNFYFHATTAYAILRHNGVEIGKNDFLGSS
ncbi:protein containing Domain of unknown function DUF1993 [mine drainage metagenome]|uniref:DUF1993 domain-containing protein n=3 Tax=mine drainage metagenome TaxID=410659 RepID=T0YKK5_9ZZZZ